MTPDQFREMFSILHNFNLWDLEEAGVINPGAKGGSDWTRFNRDLTTFVLKLPAARLASLVALIQSHQPKKEQADV